MQSAKALRSSEPLPYRPTEMTWHAVRVPLRPELADLLVTDVVRIPWEVPVVEPDAEEVAGRDSSSR